MIRWQVERARVGILYWTPGDPRIFAKSAMGSLVRTVSQELGLTSHPRVSIPYSSSAALGDN